MKKLTFSLLAFTAALVLWLPMAAAAETDSTDTVVADENPLTVAQAEPAAGESMQVSESAEAEPAAEEGEEEGEKKNDKWWSIGFGYQFAHNLQRERPTAVNSLSVDPGFKIPFGVDLNIGLHLGASVTTEYSADEPGARDLTVNTADFDPISLSISRAFVIDKEYTGFTITPSIGQLFPYTSKIAGQANDWVYALKPGVALSLSRWSVSLSNSSSLQKNFHLYDFRAIKSEGDGGDEPMPLNSFSFTNATSLRYSVWKMDMGVAVAWTKSWRYHPETTEQANNAVSYTADVGITPYDAIYLNLGITTNGPERLYGFGSDYVVPFDPRFTMIFFGISYSL